MKTVSHGPNLRTMEVDVQELTADSIRKQRIYQKVEAVGTAEK